MSAEIDQQTLSGQEVQYPECEFHDCSDQSTRVFILRGCNKDKTYRCEQEDHKPYWKGKGGIENVRPVEPEKDAVNARGETSS